MASYNKEKEQTSTILVDPQVWNRVKIEREHLIADELPKFNRIASSSKREKEMIVSRYERDSDQTTFTYKGNTSVLRGFMKGVQNMATNYISAPMSNHLAAFLPANLAEPKEPDQHFPKVKKVSNNILIDTNLLAYIRDCHYGETDFAYLKTLCEKEQLGSDGYFTELQLKHRVSNKEREQVLQIVEQFDNITKRGEIPVTGDIERYTTRMKNEILLRDKAYIWTMQREEQFVLCFRTLFETYDNVKGTIALTIQSVDHEKIAIGSHGKGGAPGPHRPMPQTNSNTSIQTPIHKSNTHDTHGKNKNAVLSKTTMFKPSTSY